MQNKLNASTHQAIMLQIHNLRLNMKRTFISRQTGSQQTLESTSALCNLLAVICNRLNLPHRRLVNTIISKLFTSMINSREKKNEGFMHAPEETWCQVWGWVECNNGRLLFEL